MWGRALQENLEQKPSTCCVWNCKHLMHWCGFHWHIFMLMNLIRIYHFVVEKYEGPTNPWQFNFLEWYGRFDVHVIFQILNRCVLANILISPQACTHVFFTSQLMVYCLWDCSFFLMQVIFGEGMIWDPSKVNVSWLILACFSLVWGYICASRGYIINILTCIVQFFS